MKITLDGTGKEIADLVLALQGQPKKDSPKEVLTELDLAPIFDLAHSGAIRGMREDRVSPKALLKESLNSALRESTRDTNEEMSS